MTTLTRWPNSLGYDLGDSEIWIHSDAFRVFTLDKVMRIPFYVTRDPETAHNLCVLNGLDKNELDDMNPLEAQALYLSSAPQQSQLFG